MYYNGEQREEGELIHEAVTREESDHILSEEDPQFWDRVLAEDTSMGSPTFPVLDAETSAPTTVTCPTRVS